MTPVGRWPQGEAEIESMLDGGDLASVAPDPITASSVLADARRRVASARVIADSDPMAGVTLAYDASRKAMLAVLLAQGLRPAGPSDHRSTADAVRAQLGSTHQVIKPFDFLRRQRADA